MAGRRTLLWLLGLLVLISFEKEIFVDAKSKTKKDQSLNSKKCAENAHYCVLDVSSTASEEEIKKQYRKLAKIYHPDKNRDNPAAAEEQFVRISRAYEVLSDTTSRRNYDDELRFGFSTGGSGAQNSFQRGSPFHHDEHLSEMFRSFQSMFGEEFGHGGGSDRGFHSRQQQQHFSQRPNQKVYFTQRGADGRTYYYEYNTQPNQQYKRQQQFFGEEDDDSWDPFAFLFHQQQQQRRRQSQTYTWYLDFVPSSPLAKFLWQVGYYMFFLYLMLSLVSCCSGPTPSAGPHREAAITDNNQRNQQQQQRQRNDESKNKKETASPVPPTSRGAKDAIYPLPVISSKEITESRGIIFVVAMSNQMEQLLRLRRKSFNQDPVLFRRYHLTSNGHTVNNRYEEILLLEKLFGSKAIVDDMNANADELFELQWRVVTVAKTGSKFAVYTPSSMKLSKLKALEESSSQAVDAVLGADLDNWLCRLIQGLEPWRTTSQSLSSNT
jgi:curved DNA-binding protein CbpA